jgi:hypothetical protein
MDEAPPAWTVVAPFGAEQPPPSPAGYAPPPYAPAPPGSGPPPGYPPQHPQPQQWGPPAGYPQPQPYGQQPYGQQPGYHPAPGTGPPAGTFHGYGYAPTAMPTLDKGARTALILAIVGLFLCGAFLGPAAMIEGSKARRRIRGSHGMLTGDGLATAGMIIGGVDIAFFLLWLVVVVSGA